MEKLAADDVEGARACCHSAEQHYDEAGQDATWEAVAKEKLALLRKAITELEGRRAVS